MKALAEDQLLAEIEDLLRVMPSRSEIHRDSEENLSWLGRASAVMHMWSPMRAARFDTEIRKLHSLNTLDVHTGTTALVTLLHQARHDLRLRSVGPSTLHVATGGVFDYFDEIRKVIEGAARDLLFVDPYLDAEFVSRYLPHVSPGVFVRLLARERMLTLLPAVSLLRQQATLSIEVRAASGFHDRYVFVDGCACYQSGASFKDGAKKAPTTLTQIVDAFDAVAKTYEGLWASATPHSC